MRNQEAPTQQFTGEYRISVENFGPIREASVDMRPLTVFIGPSNTGKSYLAILIYALHQCFDSGEISTYRRPLIEPLESMVTRFLMGNERASFVLEKFKDWLVQEFETGSEPPLPEDVSSYVRSILEHPEGANLFLEDEIGRCFGTDDLSKLIRRRNSPIRAAKINIHVPRKAVEGTMRYGFEVRRGRKGIISSGEIGGVQSLSKEIKLPDNRNYLSLFLENLRLSRRITDFEGLELGMIFTSMVIEIFKTLHKPLYREAYYLPADRTGVMHSHQVVVSALVEGATTAGIRPSANTPILSGVLADFLRQLIEMSERSTVRRRRRSRQGSTDDNDLSERLESRILKGAVRLDRTETGYPRFAYRPDGWNEDLPLTRASSMVSELAPVALFLRNLVLPGDVLIIEEPESHLHPGMQVEFTRQIAAMVRAGIRVIVTTHSEWLLEELANLVRLSQIPEARRKGIPGSDVALRPDQVGAWLFIPKARPKGSTVREVALDDSGLYPSGFNDVAVALHNNWAEISSRTGEN